MKVEKYLKLKELYLCEFNINETFSQLKAGGMHVLWSWGIHRITNFENKLLLFRVKGRKHKGYVAIALDGSDTYTVHFLNVNCDVLKTIDMVYCDMLTEIIDNEVETD